MKLRNVLIPVLLGLSLTGCNDDSSFIGTYQNADKQLLEIAKTNDSKQFIVETNITITTNGRKGLLPYRVVTYKKDNKFFELKNDTLVGTLQNEEFSLSKNGVLYKKKQ